MLTNLIEKVGKIGFYITGLILIGLFMYIGLTPWAIGGAILFITIILMIATKNRTMVIINNVFILIYYKI